MTNEQAIKHGTEQLEIFGGEHKEFIELAIEALETMKELKERKMTVDVLENYMIFEDECVKNGFTFKSLLEAREKQIPKKPIPSWNGKCACCSNCNTETTRRILIGFEKHCPDCGQAIDWSEKE